MDNLTILRTDKIAAKRIFLDENDQPVVGRAERSLLFDVETASVDGLHAIHGWLQQLQDDPHRIIIRGQLIEGRPNERVRRTFRPQNGEPGNFAAVARRWVMIDIDQIPLPAEWKDVNRYAAEIVQHAISQLPPEFHGVACAYQWSGSMGFKEGQIRLHLWFWLDRPVHDSELKAWLVGHPVDLALFSSVQPHFTANPVIEAGITDPLERRVGMFEPTGGDSVVAVPNGLNSRATAPRHRQHVDGNSHVDAQGITRDQMAGLVVDGRERFLLLKSNDATRELLRARRPSKELPSVEEIADLTWEKFSAEADLFDGRWAKDDARKEAQRRFEELENGGYSFTSRSDTTTLEPAPGPFADLTLVSKEEGQVRLERCLSSFFERIDDSPRLAVRLTTGAGKTRATLQHLKTYLTASFGKLIEIYVPRHDLAEQYVRDIEALGGFTAEIVHVMPRTGGSKGELPVLCQRPDYVRSLEQAKLGVFQNACCSNEGETCRQYGACPYIKQFDNPEPWAENHGNVVRIYVHQYLGLPRNPLQQDPDLVVIDEAFLNEVLDTGVENTPADIKRYIKTDKFPKLGRLICDALEECEPLLMLLRDQGIAPSDLDAVDLDSLLPAIDFEPERQRAATLTGKVGLHRSLATMLRLIKDELSLRPQRDQIERLVYDPRKDVVRLAYLTDVEIPETSAVLCLDATADRMLLEEVLGPIKLERIDVEQNAIVTQVYDRTGSKKSWESDKAPLDDLIEVVNTWAEFGEMPLVVGHKAFADRLRQSERLNPDVKVSHFSALRGSNAAEDCSVVFIAGRNMPPPPEVDLKARALFWAAGEPLQHDEAASFRREDERPGPLPLQFRGYIQSDRNPCPQSGVHVPSFSDQRVEALHAQIRDAETMQALGRLRLVHSQYRKRVFLLSNLPVEIQVDQLAEFTDLMPDRLELELLKKGNVPLTPLGLRKMRPDLTLSGSLAQKLLQRSRVRDVSRLRSIPELARSGLIVVSFEVKNKGRTTRQEHLFMVPDHVGQRLREAPAAQVSRGRIPVKDWLCYLEKGDPEIEGSGWGWVNDPQVRYA